MFCVELDIELSKLVIKAILFLQFVFFLVSDLAVQLHWEFKL